MPALLAHTARNPFSLANQVATSVTSPSNNDVRPPVRFTDPPRLNHLIPPIRRGVDTARTSPLGEPNSTPGGPWVQTSKGGKIIAGVVFGVIALIFLFGYIFFHVLPRYRKNQIARKRREKLQVRALQPGYFPPHINYPVPQGTVTDLQRAVEGIEYGSPFKSSKSDLNFRNINCSSHSETIKSTEIELPDALPLGQATPTDLRSAPVPLIKDGFTLQRFKPSRASLDAVAAGAVTAVPLKLQFRRQESRRGSVRSSACQTPIETNFLERPSFDSYACSPIVETASRVAINSGHAKDTSVINSEASSPRMPGSPYPQVTSGEA